LPNSSPTCSEMTPRRSAPPEISPLDRLELADPYVAQSVRSALADVGRSVSTKELDLLVSETIEALAMASAFGNAVAQGFVRLVGRVTPARLQIFAQRLAESRREGAGLGQLLAELLPTVLLAENETVLAAFETTLATLLVKGNYAVKGPMGLICRLLDRGEEPAALALLDLIDTCFALPLTYNRSIYLTQFLPQAVAGFDPQRRPFQIEQLKRVIQVDQQLAEAFVEGLAAGAGRLSAAALADYVTYALARNRGKSDAVRRYLSLEAHSAREYCLSLRTSVSLADVRGQLSRYLQARLGVSMTLRDLGELGVKLETLGSCAPLVVADGRHLYLPVEIGSSENRRENRQLYKTLVKLEAACFEFGSFEFDRQRLNLLVGRPLKAGAAGDGESCSDLERFLQAFPQPQLAEALFNTFEHGRLRLAVAARYPGLDRQMAAIMARERLQALASHPPGHLLLPLYAAVALGQTDPQVRRAAGDGWPLVAGWVAKAATDLAPGNGVEASACLVKAAYAEIKAWIEKSTESPDHFWTPFGRRLRPDLVGRSFAAQDRIARRVRRALEKRDISIFQSDLRKRLQRQAGALDENDLHELIRNAGEEMSTPATSGGRPPNLADLDFDALLERNGSAAATSLAAEEDIYRYPEWDAQVGEYLTRHTLVRERRLPGVSGSFYRRTLERHYGLVTRIRRAFEFLKPQGLQLLRPWREGDSFDYRAMLDFAIDKRAGLIPSDRLYVKRIKHRRDVAVLLLVDLSRSTANPAQGTSQTVLNITQTAIVLFCEALQVVGDRFAIAGFSGTGRLGVDYLRIKDFDEAMGPAVQGRIAAMTPLRATRMGAAIRHATHHLAALPAGLRLLMVLGDGFPNDTGYKGMTAIKDTRRAIQEARARQVHTRGITVNLGSDARLDDLYGKAHHAVIADVRDLPNRLFEIYGRLTRM
jgi:nitric oxide reductase NorD protein